MTISNFVFLCGFKNIFLAVNAIEKAFYTLIIHEITAHFNGLETFFSTFFRSKHSVKFCMKPIFLNFDFLQRKLISWAPKPILLLNCYMIWGNYPC